MITATIQSISYYHNPVDGFQMKRFYIIALVCLLVGFNNAVVADAVGSVSAYDGDN